MPRSVTVNRNRGATGEVVDCGAAPLSDAVLVVFGIRVSSPDLWDDPPMASDRATTDARLPQTTSDLPVRSMPATAVLAIRRQASRQWLSPIGQRRALRP